MTRIFFAAIAAAALSGGTALAHEWDVNEDAFIDRTEYMAGVSQTRLFEAYDVDNDGVVSQEEFYDATFRIYDEDDDDRWSEDETEVFADVVTRTGAEVSQ